MCGRYALKTSVPEIARILGASESVEFPPSYNVAPTRKVPVCRVSETGAREIALLRWGLVPHWARAVDDKYRMINARAESVASKPAFRTPFRRRRCLVPADGYYEWKAIGKRKQPYFICMQDEAPFFLAGLWDRWGKGEDERVDSFTIVTTTANDSSAEVHERMPVILGPENHEVWLDPAIQDTAALTPLLGPYAGEGMMLRPVSTYVNSPRNDDPRCVESLAHIAD
jgi:putative SOS response-associated peptidase YedK